MRRMRERQKERFAVVVKKIHGTEVNATQSDMKFLTKMLDQFPVEAHTLYFRLLKRI